MNNKISIVIPTARAGMEKILYQQLDKQIFKDFDVIVVDTLFNSRDIKSDKYNIIHIKSADKKEGDVWTLNKDYNLALKEAHGELLVFLQDFIWIPANGLQRFWDMYQIYPEALITGCGHKAKKGIEGISEVDERVFGEKKITECDWTGWELNWASCPKKIMPSFDEKMDQHYGGENQIIALKAVKKGYDVYLDNNNECIGYSQEECGGRPADWEKCHSNKEGRLSKIINSIIR